MINILEKDGATIITIENPTDEERKLINNAKNIRDNTGNENSKLNGIWEKFKCNQKITEHKDKSSVAEDSEGFIEILGFDELPF